MKNFVLIIVLSNLTILGKAQGNLQFNQVLTYNGTLTSSTSPGLSPTYSCPAGKVWKIESKTKTPCKNNGYYVNYPAVTTLNCYLNGTWFQDYYVSEEINNSPLWLKAGDYIYFELINQNTIAFPNASYPYFMSIIEYNITP